MQSSSSKLYNSFFSHDVLFVLELMAIVLQEEGYRVQIPGLRGTLMGTSGIRTI
jgi:hypothetical protein